MSKNKTINVWYETVENGRYKCGYVTMAIEEFNKLVEECQNECSGISKK